MIQVYRHNGLYFILDTVTYIVYPNLNEQEAKAVLDGMDRNISLKTTNLKSYNAYCNEFYTKDILRELNKLNGE